MKNQHHSSQGSREQGFELSYKLAREQLSKISDIEEQCHNSGSQCVGLNKIIIDYLNQPYDITMPDVEVSSADSKTEVPMKDKS